MTSPESRSADKARIIRLTNGTLVAAWHEGIGAPDRAWTFAGVAHAPRDIFVRVSADDGVTWSDAVNVSGTSELTDATVFYDPAGDGAARVNFYGDSSKPTLVAAGNQLLFTWNDSYCGPGQHGPARFAGPLGDIEVPYRCLYAARVTVAAGGVNIVAVDRITDASRDVANQVARATGAGFALAWQEDPRGLQLGEARGDGDGGSGARVSPGTEIWYAWMPRSRFADPAGTWGGPTAITNNYDFTGGAAIGGGASRPNMALAGSPPTAILVYEEAKDVGPADLGKYVRFHAFPFNQPAAAEPGVIVSDPSENSRRARIVAMSKPGSETGARMLVMWRQGQGIQGAPADF
ncbi:MAG TPA: sialidase family protein, partial [Woeseiaceae bacterium]|nr:sialidase family protein [Woeseiaceae bacterium]